MLRLFTFAFLLFVSSAHSQVLWQQAAVGMSPDQVIAAVPGATLLEKPRMERDGGVSAVRLTGIDIAGCGFQATFTFKSERLAEVRVSCSPPSPAETERVGKDVLEALRAKYGNEISRDRSSIGTQHIWFSSGVKVGLDVIQIGGGSGLVNVYYGTGTAKDASKL